MQKLTDIVISIISEHQICLECLGRQFSLLGTELSNSERAKSLLNTLIMEIHNEFNKNSNQGVLPSNKLLDNTSDTIEPAIINDSSPKMIIKDTADDYGMQVLKNIASNCNFTPAKKMLDNYKIIYKDYDTEFSCYLCNNWFQRQDEIIQKIIESARNFEFITFLIGSVIDARIQDREDEFRTKFKISTGEAFKRNLNRVIGLKLSEYWVKEVDFLNPEMTVVIHLNPNSFNIVYNPISLCIKGRYHKYERGIPQTHWPHRACHGKGCKECNFTGKQYPTSVEELLSPFFMKYAMGTEAVFHGGGREDIDARCIGTGRPFVIEIKNPKVRTIDLERIMKEIRETNGSRVDAIELEIVSRNEIMKLKEKGEETTKVYSALVESTLDIDKGTFETKMQMVLKTLLSSEIMQRTPIRVIHRRADLTRPKRIYDIKFEWIDPTHFRFVIKAMGGTYIKELISGDDGRTSPSITELIGISMKCIELDVIEIN